MSETHVTVVRTTKLLEEFEVARFENVYNKNITVLKNNFNEVRIVFGNERKGTKMVPRIER